MSAISTPATLQPQMRSMPDTVAVPPGSRSGFAGRREDERHRRLVAVPARSWATSAPTATSTAPLASGVIVIVARYTRGGHCGEGGDPAVADRRSACSKPTTARRRHGELCVPTSAAGPAIVTVGRSRSAARTNAGPVAVAGPVLGHVRSHRHLHLPALRA